MDITIKLPDDLVERAQAAGILTGEQVAELIEAELDPLQRRKQFYADLETLRSLEPPENFLRHPRHRSLLNFSKT